MFGAPLVMAQGGSERQYIGTPMSPSANRLRQYYLNMFCGFIFMFGPPLLLAQEASVRH